MSGMLSWLSTHPPPDSDNENEVTGAVPDFGISRSDDAEASSSHTYRNGGSDSYPQPQSGPSTVPSKRTSQFANGDEFKRSRTGSQFASSSPSDSQPYAKSELFIITQLLISLDTNSRDFRKAMNRRMDKLEAKVGSISEEVDQIRDWTVMESEKSEGIMDALGRIMELLETSQSPEKSARRLEVEVMDAANEESLAGYQVMPTLDEDGSAGSHNSSGTANATQSQIQPLNLHHPDDTQYSSNSYNSYHGHDKAIQMPCVDTSGTEHEGDMTHNDMMFDMPLEVDMDVHGGYEARDHDGMSRLLMEVDGDEFQPRDMALDSELAARTGINPRDIMGPPSISAVPAEADTSFLQENESVRPNAEGRSMRKRVAATITNERSQRRTRKSNATQRYESTSAHSDEDERIDTPRTVKKAAQTHQQQPHLTKGKRTQHPLSSSTSSNHSSESPSASENDEHAPKPPPRKAFPSQASLRDSDNHVREIGVNVSALPTSQRDLASMSTELQSPERDVKSKSRRHSTRVKIEPKSGSSSSQRQARQKEETYQSAARLRKFKGRASLAERCLAASDGKKRTGAEWLQKGPNTATGRLEEITCDVCKGRCHWSCAGLPEDKDMSDEIWVCPDCAYEIQDEDTDRILIETVQQVRCIRYNCILREKRALDHRDGQEELYFVEKILGRRATARNPETKERIFEYLVKWDGYDLDECTWEPESNLKPHFTHWHEVFMAKVKKTKSNPKLRVCILPEARSHWDENTGNTLVKVEEEESEEDDSVDEEEIDAMGIEVLPKDDDIWAKKKKGKGSKNAARRGGKKWAKRRKVERRRDAKAEAEAVVIIDDSEDEKAQEAEDAGVTAHKHGEDELDASPKKDWRLSQNNTSSDAFPSVHDDNNGNDIEYETQHENEDYENANEGSHSLNENQATMLQSNDANSHVDHVEEHDIVNGRKSDHVDRRETNPEVQMGDHEPEDQVRDRLYANVDINRGGGVGVVHDEVHGENDDEHDQQELEDELDSSGEDVPSDDKEEAQGQGQDEDDGQNRNEGEVPIVIDESVHQPIKPPSKLRWNLFG